MDRPVLHQLCVILSFLIFNLFIGLVLGAMEEARA